MLSCQGFVNFISPGTTRPARDGEVNGVDYIFVTLEQFKAMERDGHLLESGEFDGNIVHYSVNKLHELFVRPSKLRQSINFCHTWLSFKAVINMEMLQDVCMYALLS